MKKIIVKNNEENNNDMRKIHVFEIPVESIALKSLN